MTAVKVAVTVQEEVIEQIDGMVACGEFKSRSRVVQVALLGLLQQRRRGQRLLGELAKFEPAEERALANEDLAAEPPWPRY